MKRVTLTKKEINALLTAIDAEINYAIYYVVPEDEKQKQEYTKYATYLKSAQKKLLAK